MLFSFLKFFSILISFGALEASSAINATYTSAKDPNLSKDFIYQGEYTGETHGAQVISLGNGHFQAVLFPGGLPGSGWDKKNKSLVSGTLVENSVILKNAEGERSYLAKDPSLFSATKLFPPPGHKLFSGSIESEIMTLLGENGEKLHLKKIIRESPSLGKKHPENAIILFDGSNKDEWVGGRIDPKTKLLHTDGKDIISKKKFNDYHLHLEFLLPYRPSARGQARGNSGLYHVSMYENQILDTFGLEGLHNECGGIYSLQNAMVNACFPPLSWQTYDIDFVNARNSSGEKISNARITAKLNGILIHDGFEIPTKTGGSRPDPEGTPGKIKLQGHNNPLQFKNIWIVKK